MAFMEKIYAFSGSPHLSFCRGFSVFWALGTGELETRSVCDVRFLEYYNVE